jgi:hypothetical protein
MILEIPRTMQGTTSSLRTIAYTHNMYPRGGVFLGRTGIDFQSGYAPKTTATDSEHVPRGLFRSRVGEIYYCIFGDRLFRAADKGATSLTLVDAIDMPAIPSSGNFSDKKNASIATSYTDIAIATGTANYLLNPDTHALVEIVDTDLPACRSVVYIDGRFVWLTSDGESVFFSDVNAPTDYSALSFFDAESRPDKNVELLVLGNDLYVLGETSIERFRSTGDSATPFVRVSNSVLSVGYIGALLPLGDSAMFIGQYESGPVEVFELTSGSLRQISYGIVSEVLNTETSIEGNYSTSGSAIKSARSQAWVDKGINIMSFWLNGQFSNICFSATKANDGSYEWGTLSDNPANTSTTYREWGENSIISNIGGSQVNGKNFTWCNATLVDGSWIFQRDTTLVSACVGVIANGHSSSSFDGVSTNRENVSKGIRFFIERLDGNDFNLDSLEVIYELQGTFTNQAFTLSMSKTGRPSTWSSPIEIIPSNNLASSTTSEDRVRFQKSGGLAQFSGFLALIVETNTKDGVSISRLLANV